MSPIQIETTIKSDGILTVSGLPLRVGDVVQVVIQPKEAIQDANPYPLRGLPVVYIDPFEPACPPDEWEVLRDAPSKAEDL